MGKLACPLNLVSMQYVAQTDRFLYRSLALLRGLPCVTEKVNRVPLAATARNNLFKREDCKPAAEKESVHAGLVTAANLLVFVHLIGGYQVYM